MTGFTLAAVAGVAAGLMIGAAATVGVTLTLDVTADHGRAPTQIAPAARSLSVPYPCSTVTGVGTVIAYRGHDSLVRSMTAVLLG